MIAIISDVHGNYEALYKVLDTIDSMGITEIYCLGDIVGYYSQVNECCDALRARKAKCIMGNHDWYMVSGSKCLRSRSVNDCLKFQREIISEKNLKWLSTLPVIIDEYGISMVHGGWLNPIDEYLEFSEEYFNYLEKGIFISGHTHIQGVYYYKDKVYCNPGSVGQPRDGDNRAAFATFDGREFKLHRVDYNIARVGELMEQAGFSQYYYGCLRDASKKLHI